MYEYRRTKAHPPERKAARVVLIRTRWYSLSRRGAVLALFGTVFALLGYSYLSIDARLTAVLHAQLRFALDVAPVEFYGWAWVVCGLLAILGGLVHPLDGLGFAAAVFMPALWSVVYFLAWFHDDAPRAWVNGCLFGAIALVLVVVAGMADPLAREPK